MLPLASTGHSSRPQPQQFGVRKGSWTQQEDTILNRYIVEHGVGKWSRVPQLAGLNRCRKSCRLRWLNYLSPDIKRGSFTEDEEDLIIRLHKLLGNRWSLIAGRLSGRTANDVKNYWNTHLIKKSDALDKKEMSVSVRKPVKPKPRTISANWFWSSNQAPTRVEYQKEETEMNLRPSAEVHEAPVDNLMISEDLNHAGLRAENILMEELQANTIWVEDAVAFRDEELIEEEAIGWEGLLSEIDLWG